MKLARIVLLLALGTALPLVAASSAYAQRGAAREEIALAVGESRGLSLVGVRQVITHGLKEMKKPK